MPKAINSLRCFSRNVCHFRTFFLSRRNDMEWSRCRTTQLTDRHDLTYENQKLQGNSPSANGGSVQRLVRPRLLRKTHISPALGFRTCCKDFLPLAPNSLNFLRACVKLNEPFGQPRTS